MDSSTVMLKTEQNFYSSDHRPRRDFEPCREVYENSMFSKDQSFSYQYVLELEEEDEDDDGDHRNKINTAHQAGEEALDWSTSMIIVAGVPKGMSDHPVINWDLKPTKVLSYLPMICDFAIKISALPKGQPSTVQYAPIVLNRGKRVCGPFPYPPYDEVEEDDNFGGGGGHEAAGAGGGDEGGNGGGHGGSDVDDEGDNGSEDEGYDGDDEGDDDGDDGDDESDNGDDHGERKVIFEKIVTKREVSGRMKLPEGIEANITFPTVNGLRSRRATVQIYPENSVGWCLEYFDVMIRRRRSNEEIICRMNSGKNMMAVYDIRVGHKLMFTPTLNNCFDLNIERCDNEDDATEDSDEEEVEDQDDEAGEEDDGVGDEETEVAAENVEENQDATEDGDEEEVEDQDDGVGDEETEVAAENVEENQDAN